MNRGARSERARERACALRASASLLIALALALPSLASAFDSRSANYRNTRSAQNQGGKSQGSTGYSNAFSAGGLALTTHTSTSFTTRSGFPSIAFHPGRVTGLWSSTGTLDGTVDLQWTAPGNDGYAPGTSAGAFDIRVTSKATQSPAISDALFNAAVSVTPAPPTPASQGATQSYTATGLLEGVTYYFAMKARERDGIPGVLSAGTTVQTRGPFGCVITKNVCKAGDCGFTTIQSAVNALPNPLIGHSCVIIRDAQLYGEQVRVEGFVNNGSSITIARAPEVAGRPTVDPGPELGSIAGFRIHNASVNIAGIDVAPSAPQQYGVLASSDFVKLSSVNVDAGLNVTSAGIRISSWSAVSNSSVTVDGAHGLWVTGSTNTVTASTAATNGTAFFALYLNGADRNTVTGSFFQSSSGRGIELDSGADYNTISQSTGTGATIAYSGLRLTASSSNTITGSYFFRGATLRDQAEYNTISLSTIANTGGGNHASLQVIGDYNTVSDAFITRTSSHGVRLEAAAQGNLITKSTVTSAGQGYAGVLVLGDDNRLADSYIEGSTAAFVSAAAGTVVSGSRLASNDLGGSALRLGDASDGLTLEGSVLSGGGWGAGLLLEAGNSGTILVSTNTILPASRYGIYAGDPLPGSALWIASNTVVPLLWGATDTYGVYLDALTSGATLYNNSVVYRSPASTLGSTAYALRVQGGSGLVVKNNRFSNPGMVLGGNYRGASFAGVQAAVFNFNDLLSTGTALDSGRLLELSAGTTIQARNNVYLSSMAVTASSATLFLSADSGIDSNYNDFFSSNSANTATWGSVSYSLPSAWSSATGHDQNSQSAHPHWFDPSAGVEDFHPLSQGTGPGTGRCSDPPLCTTFVSDAFSSLTIDAGDPAEPFDNETEPNGDTVNQGSFGNTIEASQSPPILSVVLSTGLYDFGSVNMVVANSTVAVSSIIAVNNGTIPETFQLSATVVTPGSQWQLGEQPDIETVKLQLLFNTTQPTAAQFDAVASTVTASAQPSGNGTANGNNYLGDQSGYQVPVQGKRSMWHRLTAPTSTIHNGQQQTIRVTVTAIP